MLIKVKFTRNGIPSGKEYAYRSSIPVKIGDLVELPNGTGIVTAVNVSESEVEGFKDKVKEIVGLKINEHEKAKECMEFLRNYCKPDNCTMNCPFAYKDYTLHCNLGGSTQMYPCDWETEQKEWGEE